MLITPNKRQLINEYTIVRVFPIIRGNVTMTFACLVACYLFVAQLAAKPTPVANRANWLEFTQCLEQMKK